nr:retrovirus-related Pol polyprotein from transposon TNT 1-94 [Tanacetum cinerariifolium]
MEVRDFKKFFKRRGRFVRQPRNNKKRFQRSCDDKNSKSDRKCFRCGDPNHLIGECQKPPKDKNQRAFVGGSWSDSDKEDDEKVKNKMCLVAQASSEICLGVDLEPDEWIKDSGCSKHMTGNRKLFTSYKAYNGGNVIFGSNLRGNIIGKEESKLMKTHMSSDTKLTKDEEGESVDSTKYRGMIGSLLYPMTSRPDIMFSVCLCARFQEAPKTSHLEAVKRIFRYIKGTTQLGLWYPKGTGIKTVIYVDSDHARGYVDRKSTSGIYTFVGCCLTSWFSKKQTAFAISTIEAEYVSAEKACQQALRMKQALIDYDIRLDDVPIMCDNKDAIDLSKNPMQHSRTKHIEIRHHFLHDNDACVFTDKWSLDELACGVPTDDPYQTKPPSPDDIISSIRIDLEGQVRRILHEEEINVHEY